MKSFESSGRTVEEAISAGLAEHGLSIGDVNVEILEEGSKGLFGLFGSRDARVRLVVSVQEHDDTMDLLRDTLSGKPRRQRPEPQAAKAEPAPAQKPVARPARQPRTKAEPKAERAEQPAAPKAAREKKPREPREKRPAPREQEPIAVVREPRVLTAVSLAAPDSPEGLAQGFLQELTTLMGLSISISLAKDEEGHVFATMDGDPQGILIGRRGETLDALQYLTSLHVNKGREDYIRVTLDSEGYRAKREEALIRLANRLANRARKTGRRVSMEPMNPYERRIFHSALQAAPGIATHSEGEEPNRHIVITPVKEQGAQ